MIPHALAGAIESTIGERVAATTPVAGGCINRGSRLETGSGKRFFLKWNERAPLEMFVAEVDGLASLREATGLRIPEPVGWGATDGGVAWFVMEYIGPGVPGRDFDERLGVGLAELHTTVPRADFGWRRDNWIGSLPQSNAGADSWAAFWAGRRIEPQLGSARERGLLADPVFDRLVDSIPRALENEPAPSLLHGDLWSGNVYADRNGMPVLIDPAVYVGHAEVDLAMTELFGGFAQRFYDAYRDRAGRDDAYAAFRRDLYQLYYLLVHVNLFGATYAAGALAAARRVVSELG